MPKRKHEKKKAVVESGQQFSAIQFNRQFGQHILKNPLVTVAMVEKAGIKPTDEVFEVGPGTGNLTMRLLTVAKHVTAFEVDSRLAAELEKRVRNSPYHSRLSIRIGDCLQSDWPYFDVCVTNLPYQISSPFIFKLLLHEHFRCAIVMLQREFAERLIAKVGEKQYCRLTANVQLLARVSNLMRVGRNSFRPPPKVESNVVRIEPRRPRPPLNYAEWDGLLRICFARKNRTIAVEFRSDKVVEMLLKNYRICKALRNSEGTAKAAPHVVISGQFEAEDKSDAEITFEEMRDKIANVLETSGFAKQRARKIDVDGYLALLHAFNAAGIHFA